MISYDYLINVSKTFGLGFELELVNLGGDSLKMSNHYNPWSLKENEASIIFSTIIKNNLQRGFEVATAFGVSSTIIGSALKLTKGKLVTLDAYIEEMYNDCNLYDSTSKLVKSADTADGYKMAYALLNHFQLKENVFLEIGWSPDDVPSVINRNFGNTKLDFAFIDGGHSVKQIDADVNILLPYLAHDSIVMFHDHYSLDNNIIKNLLASGFTNHKRYETSFDLAMYSRGNKVLV